MAASKPSTYAGDERTAQDAFAFVQGFLERFPKFKQRPLWLSGESYGGKSCAQSISARQKCKLASSICGGSQAAAGRSLCRAPVCGALDACQRRLPQRRLLGMQATTCPTWHGSCSSTGQTGSTSASTCRASSWVRLLPACTPASCCALLIAPSSISHTTHSLQLSLLGSSRLAAQQLHVK